MDYKPGFDPAGYPNPNPAAAQLVDDTGAPNDAPETDRAPHGAGVLVAAVAGLALYLVLVIVWRALA